MEILTTSAQLFSSIAYFIYGASCLSSNRMVVEFERYQMPEYRRLTGFLQIFASIGLLLGFLYTWLAVISSLGLALQMVVGGVVRVRIKDSLIQTLPAIIFCAINMFIFYRRYFEL